MQTIASGMLEDAAMQKVLTVAKFLFSHKTACVWCHAQPFREGALRKSKKYYDP